MTFVHFRAVAVHILHLLGLLVLIESHQRSWFVLLTHHFNGSLGWIKIEFVILLSSLTCFVVFLVVKFTIRLVIFGASVKIFSSVISLRNRWSSRIFLIKLRQWKTTVLRWLIIHLWLWSTFTSRHILSIVDISNIVLHQDQMCILVRTLLRLSLFNSVVQKLHSFFIFFFQFGFNAFVLNILKSVHLEIIFLLDCSFVDVLTTNRWLILHTTHITSCILNLLIFLSFLSHLCEFDVTFIENYFLNIVSWHLSHEKALSISIFIPLNNFIFEADKLQNLREHAGFHRSFLLETFWHDWRHLWGKDFNWFGSISKLIKLSKNLTSFSLEFRLKYFQSLIVIQLFLCHNSRLITKKCIDLMENIFGWAIASLEIGVNAYLREMT